MMGVLRCQIVGEEFPPTQSPMIDERFAGHDEACGLVAEKVQIDVPVDEVLTVRLLEVGIEVVMDVGADRRTALIDHAEYARFGIERACQPSQEYPPVPQFRRRFVH